MHRTDSRDTGRGPRRLPERIDHGHSTQGYDLGGLDYFCAIGLLLLSTGLMTVANPSKVAEQFVDKFGYPSELIVPVAIAEICCAVVYLIPRTATLGAVLLTGYLGGAIATHRASATISFQPRSSASLSGLPSI